MKVLDNIIDKTGDFIEKYDKTTHILMIIIGCIIAFYVSVFLFKMIYNL